jgi:hypothetical protein
LQTIIIITLLFSVLSGITERTNLAIPLTSLTLLPLLLLFFYFLLKLMKLREILNYKTLNLYIYGNILVIVFGLFFVSFSLITLKFILYYLFIFILINSIYLQTINKIYKIVCFLVILFTIEIFFRYMQLIVMDISLVNLRHYTIMDKQYYLLIYSISIPVAFWELYFKKSLKNLLMLLFMLLGAVIFMQIKTLILTLPISIILIFIFVLKRYSKIKLALFSILSFSIFMFLIISQNPYFKQINAVIYYIFGKSELIPVEDMIYVDTLIVRLAIFRNIFHNLNDNLISGIGYGHYTEIVEGITVKSVARNIFYDLPVVTESGFLLFLVEGGILGLVFHILIYGIILMNLKKFNQNKIELISLTIFINNGFSNLFQDNINLVYWFFIGVVYFLMIYWDSEEKLISKGELQVPK